MRTEEEYMAEVRAITAKGHSKAVKAEIGILSVLAVIVMLAGHILSNWR